MDCRNGSKLGALIPGPYYGGTAIDSCRGMTRRYSVLYIVLNEIIAITLAHAVASHDVFLWLPESPVNVPYSSSSLQPSLVPAIETVNCKPRTPRLYTNTCDSKPHIYMVIIARLFQEEVTGDSSAAEALHREALQELATAKVAAASAMAQAAELRRHNDELQEKVSSISKDTIQPFLCPWLMHLQLRQQTGAVFDRT